MTQAKGSLTCVHTRAEKLKLKYCLEVAKCGRRERFNTEACLPDAIEDLPIWRKLTLERRQLRWPDDIKPVRIIGVELIARIEHSEAVEINGAVRLWLFCRFRRRCLTACHGRIRSSRVGCGRHLLLQLL